MPHSHPPRTYGAALLLVLIASGYVVIGRLGLLLAVPPGYATAIFPPAGLAIGAMFMLGAPSLPAAFLGSLVLNLWIGAGTGQRPVAVACSALIIAAASTVQAAAGGLALRRAVGYPAPLDNARDV